MGAIPFLEAYRFIRGRIRADAQLLADAPGGVGGRVYPEVAREGAAYPHVIIQFLGGDNVRGVGPYIVQNNGLYMVKVVDRTEDYATIEAAAQRIDAVLQAKSGPTTNGYVYSCVQFGVDPLPPELDPVSLKVTYRSIMLRYQLAIK